MRYVLPLSIYLCLYLSSKHSPWLNISARYCKMVYTARYYYYYYYYRYYHYYHRSRNDANRAVGVVNILMIRHIEITLSSISSSVPITAVLSSTSEELVSIDIRKRNGNFNEILNHRRLITG